MWLVLMFKKKFQHKILTGTLTSHSCRFCIYGLTLSYICFNRKLTAKAENAFTFAWTFWSI